VNYIVSRCSKTADTTHRNERKSDTIAKTFLTAFLLLTLAGIISAQEAGRERKMIFASIKDISQKVTDITDQVETGCSQLIKKSIGDNQILVRFQPEYREEAVMFGDRLERVFKEMNIILTPLKLPDLELFLFHMPEVPKNYKMTRKWIGNRRYVQLSVFSEKSDLNLNDYRQYSIASNIIHVLPHEVTHIMVNDLIAAKNTRWFDEGLAEYVGYSVGYAIENRLIPEYREGDSAGILPYVSLNRRDIRENIFSWDSATSVGSVLGSSPKQSFIETFYYEASYELIKLTIAEAKRRGIKNPLEILLTQLREHRERSGKPAGGDDLLSIIRQHLKVDPKSLGSLPPQKQKDLVDEAISLLSKDKPGNERKNYALYILAGLDEIKLADDWFVYLLDQIYEQKAADSDQRDIAATALTVRFKQDGFDELLKSYITSSTKLKGKSIKKIKSELAKYSLRPRPD
jgi:hypothetical protein